MCDSEELKRRAVGLCQELTRYVWHLNKQRNVHFVCAKCTDSESSYCYLVDVFEQDESKQYLHDVFMNTSLNEIMYFCFELGRAQEKLTRRRNGPLSEFAPLIKFAQAVGNGELAKLFTEKHTRTWWQQASRFLEILQGIPFRESTLSSNYKLEDYSFRTFRNIDAWTRRPQEPIFSYGWACELILTPGRDFHYCFLPEINNCRLALILWTDTTGTAAFNDIKDLVEGAIRCWWDNQDSEITIDHIMMELQALPSADKECRDFFHTVRAQLTESRTETKEALARFLKIESLYNQQRNPCVRLKFAKFLTEWKSNASQQGLILENFPFTDAERILEGDP
jgi:hypothetical protein